MAFERNVLNMQYGPKIESFTRVKNVFHIRSLILISGQCKASVTTEVTPVQ